ncbi:hypothetical protein Tco_0311618 [Tanacetum coccineum]
MNTHIDFSTYVLHNLKIENLSQELLVAVNDKLDWHNPEGHEYPFDLSKPLPLIEDQGRQVVPANYFFNNDFEYLKGGSSSRKYTTSTTKTKAGKYDNIEGIEDMVQTLWSPVKVAYDKHVVWRTSHWVTHVKVVKYDYGYLEEIEVRREDHKLYKFKEGDFPRLNLCDIEDMVLLLVQKKLSNLEKVDIFDLNVALRMFTRRAVILKRVEDLQLGVKSYQKKFNITRHETFRFDIIKITPYTAYNDPQGIIYQDKFQRNRLMPLDELYKFCDGTLSSVRRVLHDIASRLEMDYLPKRRWSKLDRKRSRIMIKAIDQQLFERRLMRNLENQNRRDLPRDIPLDSVEVLRYEKRSKSENKGKVPTEMELVLEQTQKDTSYEVSVSTEGVEELKRKVKIKGEKKEALLTLSSSCDSSSGFYFLELWLSSSSSTSLFELPAAILGIVLSTSLSIGVKVFTLLIVASNKTLSSSKDYLLNCYNV